MLEEFRNFVNENQLFDRDHKVLLAVSGGIDSVVMTRLFHQLKLRFGIMHCNFQLRGEASDGDARFVEALANELGCPFFTIAFATKQYASDNGLSTQMAARELRYNWFEEVRQHEGYELIATAHHAGDDAETFFINLIRGTGLRGLQGIPLRQGNIIRPMKFANREQIRAYADKHQICWREDATNASTHYLRNKIRHNVLPLLNVISPAFNVKLAETISHLNDTGEALRVIIERERVRLVIADDCGNQYINLDDLTVMTPVGFWLFELLQPYQFNRTIIDDITRNLSGNGGQRFLSPSFEARIERGKLILTPHTEASADEVYTIEAGVADLKQPLPLTIRRLQYVKELKVPHTFDTVWLDAALITSPLTLRRWRSGDRFHPLGMNGSKKVSDYFIDHKFSQQQKDNTWLLCHESDIVWIVGHRIDHRYRVTSATQSVLELKLQAGA
ncbi:MAG TPA: tRNA lysidine(34) synthetase TilS [Bacteroidales bacterium]|nr:MAG: tRNA lysidine(34) synthetase TilS [Bacteroidetes bacterium GWE2_42_24]OFY27903.1 MAG: tRNA lysidine(34) synthetase TilS [Bacteroidetes bacterium GWF2_43_11]HBZ68116.1 tRNA lysidine(34) synthetase TilS [Bacteroidales bacterium]